MISQTTNLSTLLNFVLTAPTKGIVEYKTKPYTNLTNKLQHYFELSLPEGVKKDDVRYLFITPCREAKPLAVEQFKHLNPPTEYFIIGPYFEDDLNADYIIKHIKDEFEKGFKKDFKKEFKEKEIETLKKIFTEEKNNLENIDYIFYYYQPFENLEIYQYFEMNYITNDLEALKAEENVEYLFGKIIDSLFDKGLMKKDILNCADFYFQICIIFKNDREIIKKDKNNRAEISEEICFFTKKLGETITDDHLKSFKKYVKDILNSHLIETSIDELMTVFKNALEKHYLAKKDYFFFMVPTNHIVNLDKYFLHRIPFVFKKQYFYFYKVLEEVHRIAKFMQQAAEAITNFNETNIEAFKKLLTTYQKAIGAETEGTIFQFIETLKTKLNKVLEQNDPNIIKAPLGTFDVSKVEHKILKFTLFLNESKYVYPEFYTFIGDALIPLEDATEVEACEFINY